MLFNSFFYEFFEENKITRIYVLIFLSYMFDLLFIELFKEIDGGHPNHKTGLQTTVRRF